MHPRAVQIPRNQQTRNAHLAEIKKKKTKGKLVSEAVPGRGHCQHVERTFRPALPYKAQSAVARSSSLTLPLRRCRRPFPKSRVIRERNKNDNPGVHSEAAN